MKPGTQVKYNHNKGIVIQIISTDSGPLAVVDWGSPTKCMCGKHPGQHLKQAEDGSWWAQAVKHYWTDDTVEITPLDKGLKVEVLNE